MKPRWKARNRVSLQTFSTSSCYHKQLNIKLQFLSKNKMAALQESNFLTN